ncbi:MAG: hypothetical protein ACPG4N_10200, partial [Gammaproteobacteria bacterium]
MIPWDQNRGEAVCTDMVLCAHLMVIICTNMVRNSLHQTSPSRLTKGFIPTSGDEPIGLDGPGGQTPWASSLEEAVSNREWFHAEVRKT